MVLAEWVLTVIGVAGPAAAPSDDAWSPATAAGREAQQWELKALDDLMRDCVDSGQAYYESGRRREAIWCWERAIAMRPDWSALQSLVESLRDFDNPRWKKKRWKSPRDDDAAFKKRQEQVDARYAALLFKVASHDAKEREPEIHEHARDLFLQVLQLVGGPYELDSDGHLHAGSVGAIPQPFSGELLASDLVLINSEHWLRDSMLRSLKDVSSVDEARGDHFVVRTVARRELAPQLLPLMEQAYALYVAHAGVAPRERLGLFVFPDQAAYQAYCNSGEFAGYANAGGFANNRERFAVTYEQAELQRLAVHEGAHLFHYAAFGASMPSWYDEGFACFFGSSMSWSDGKLTTRPVPGKSDVALLFANGQQPLPLARLLAGDAAKLIESKSADAQRFYAESWALYSFFQQTDSPRWKRAFDDWESFCLGSGDAGHGKGGKGGTTGGESSAALFHHVFKDAEPELERDFLAWLAARG